MSHPHSPCLPQNDPFQDARLKALGKARDQYVFDRSYRDIAISEKLAEGEGFSAGYIAMTAGIEAKKLQNRTSIGLHLPADTNDDGRTGFSERAAFLHAALSSELPDRRVDTLSEYRALYPAFGLPASESRYAKDWWFAYQHFAGSSPVTVRVATEIPDNFPLTDSHLRAATGDNDTLGAALAEGRLFLCDYKILDGLSCGVFKGRQKYLWAPILALAMRAGAAGPSDGLVVVGIQCNQRPSEDNPIWTPSAGVAWDMARTCVQTADCHIGEIENHTGLCHLVAESVLLASHRELAPNHPLMVLLKPHFAFTQNTNQVMRRDFIAPTGFMVEYQSPTDDSAFELVHRTLSNFDFGASDLEAHLAARGMDDPERMPWYPLRDDGLPVMRAIRNWVESYLEVYYPNDALVGADTEVRRWLAAIGDPNQGGLRGVPRVQTRSELARIVAAIIWRVTAFHSTINYTGWEFRGWVPNYPTAAFGPGPSPGTAHTEADLLAMFPPLDVTIGVQEVMYQLGHARYNRLGDYGRRDFTDARVVGAKEAFRSELAEVATATDARNRTRPVPYNYLHPDNIPASIHV